MLWHTGWASVADAQNEQELFDFYFVDSWPNDVGCAEDALSWFLNDEYRYSFTQAAYANAGYYSRLMGHYGETASDYVSVYSALQNDALQTLSASLRNGDAVGLFVDVHNDQENGRAITCWGYAVDASYSPTDPRYYSGLYITDSDDETEGKNNDRLNERALVYVDLEWRDDIPQLSSGDETVGEYLLGGYDDRTGDSRYYLVNFTTLKQRPEKYASAPDAETRSTVVTTADDVYDIYDGEISLREALDNARSGDTVSFADSLKGKTIPLDPKRGELTIKKSITVDASNLWDAGTAAPGLTINGQGNSGILGLNQGLEVEFNRITLTNGHSDSGGAIYCGSSALALNNCVVVNNFADVDGGFSWRESATLDANSTSRVATGLTPDRVYRFRVAASNELGRSEWLYGVFEASTQLNANLPAPSNLTFVNYSSESRTVDMSWTDNSDDESGFVVQYRFDGGATWRASANLDANATSRVATGIVAGRVYEFRVAAVNALGYSEWLYGSFTAPNEEIASSSATVDCRRKNEESGYSDADIEIKLADSSSSAPASAALLAAYEDASLFEYAPIDDYFELLGDSEFSFDDAEF